MKFYETLEFYLNGLTLQQRDDYKETIQVMFYEKLNYWKLPFVKNIPLQLDSRLSTLQPAKDIKADYVLSVKLLGAKKRVELPISTSSNSLRRMAQYPTGSLTLTMKNNNICVGVPFEKNVKTIIPQSVLGVDAGITDLLYSSSGNAYGSFTGMNKLYEAIVEPKLQQRSKLLAVQRNYQKELKKCTSKTRRAVLIAKIHNIAKSLHGKKCLSKKQRAYQHEVDVRLNQAIKPFVQDAKKHNNLVAMESLNITEFDRGKRNNKRDSSWVRGKLLTKLQEKLSWNGIPFVEVDPAYTSKECPKCHNVDTKSRNGKSFVCTVCKHKDDADHNASITIASRAYDEQLHAIVKKYSYNTKKRHLAIRELLLERHRSYIAMTSASAG